MLLPDQKGCSARQETHSKTHSTHIAQPHAHGRGSSDAATRGTVAAPTGQTHTDKSYCMSKTSKKMCPLDAITLAYVFALINTVGRRFLCFSASCFLAG